MDILRKELNQIYAEQHLRDEFLDTAYVEVAKSIAATLSETTGGCAVITDACYDKCYIHSAELGTLIGLTKEKKLYYEENSSDEDAIYNCLHPEDLVEKRMLEYEFFKIVNSIRGDEKKHFKATCRIRMRNTNNDYFFVENSTQIVSLSPAGRMWLILCCYCLSPDQKENNDIFPRIINNRSGEIITLSFKEKKQHILTKREKEILNLIKEGKASKNIADILEISVHTVNRHRQNIIEKLSVGNSIEAVCAATSMGLL
ncbi:MAG: helix-turn-helix transcriptional regulator [Muribaculaceae bacterium]|nr:helix-turn-helix transcriptional regulator [Muribaculaceae bacterium]